MNTSPSMQKTHTYEQTYKQTNGQQDQNMNKVSLLCNCMWGKKITQPCFNVKEFVG